MKIFLVRHGRSEGNLNKKLHATVADHAIELADLGKRQAKEAGIFLGDYFEKNIVERFYNDAPIVFNNNVRMWNSPYKRTRQTADIIQEHLGIFLKDRRENICLVEQQFGVFDGLSDPECKEMIIQKYPDEYDHFQKCLQFEGKFWARFPLGESIFDVALRMHQFFGTIQRDAQKSNVDTIIIVGHGVGIKTFIMQWMHYPVEWYDTEPTPKNCSVRLLEDNEDKGYIFEPTIYE